MTDLVNIMKSIGGIPDEEPKHIHINPGQWIEIYDNRIIFYNNHKEDVQEYTWDQLYWEFMG